MKKTVLSIVLLISQLICVPSETYAQDTKPIDPLAAIRGKIMLLLDHTDDVCGEWGGNTETIKIFRADGALHAAHTYQEIDCQNPHEKTTTKTVLTVLTDVHAFIAKEAIQELMSMILSNDQIAHSGISNRVIIGNPEFPPDMNMTIQDFPSKEWTTFEHLKKSLYNF